MDIKNILSFPKSERWIHILCLIGMPVVMSLINDNWLFTRLGYLDPWYNVGYFLHYDDPVFRANFYKIARASWLIPGFLAYKLLAPLAANFVLHVGSLVLTTGFIYLTLSRLVGRDIAFISTALLTVYYPIHGSGGWDYQTTPSGAYFAATIYFVTRAGQLTAQSQNSRNCLLFAGAAFAATFHANILFINALPVIFAFFFVLSEAKVIRKENFKASLHFGFGFLGLTVLLGIVNLAIGRRFLFFRPLISLVIRYVKDTDNEKSWWLPWSSFWWEKDYIAGYLALPAAVLFLGTAILLFILLIRRSTNSKVDKTTILLIGQFVFLGWLWVFWQSMGHVALVPDYFAYPIQLSAFICLAGIMNLGSCQLLERGNENRDLKAQSSDSTSLLRLFLRSATTSVILVGLLVLPVATMLATRVLIKNSALERSRLLYLTALATVSLLAYAGTLSFRRYWPFVLAGATFLFVQIAAITAFVAPNEYNRMFAWTTSAKEYASNEQCVDRRGSFLALLDIEKAIGKFGPPSQTALVLWDPTLTLRTKRMCDLNFADLGSSFTSLSSHYFAQENYLSDAFSDPAKMPEQSFATFPPERPLVILTVDRRYVDGVLDRFKKAGHVNMEIRDMRLVTTKTHSFYSYILMESPRLPSQTIMHRQHR